MQVLRKRRSDLSPTRMSGVYGQKCRTSGYHFDLLLVSQVLPRQGRHPRGGGKQTLSITFSSELGQSMAKQTKIKSVSG